MDGSSYGVIEILLVFGLILSWAGWELVRNRRALAGLRAESSIAADLGRTASAAEVADGTARTVETVRDRTG